MVIHRPGPRTGDRMSTGRGSLPGARRLPGVLVVAAKAQELARRAYHRNAFLKHLIKRSDTSRTALPIAFISIPQIGSAQWHCLPNNAKHFFFAGYFPSLRSPAFAATINDDF